MSRLRRPAAAFAVAWALFLVAALSPRPLAFVGLLPMLAQHAWWPHAIVKTVLAVLALLAMAWVGGDWSDWGFRAATRPRWGRSILRGGVLGAVAMALIIISPAQGMPWIRNLGLRGMVMWIWVHSSVTEEIFVRGWFQGFVRPVRSKPVRLGRWTLSPTVALSGLFFGSMHLSIVARGLICGRSPSSSPPPPSWDCSPPRTATGAEVWDPPSQLTSRSTSVGWWGPS